MGTVVAVKRLRDVTISEIEFREKIETVGAMDHENLVPLRAYYYSRDEKLLVYDYMSMGSLSALLHGEYFSIFGFDIFVSFLLVHIMISLFGFAYW
jgi:serine/threonine protein kinase